MKESPRQRKKRETQREIALRSRAIVEKGAIDRLLTIATRSETVFRHVRKSSAYRRSRLRLARATEGQLKLTGKNAWLDVIPDTTVCVRGAIQGRPYQFSVEVIEKIDDERIIVTVPGVIYEWERRDRRRIKIERMRVPVVVKWGRKYCATGSVIDVSEGGMGILVRSKSLVRAGAPLKIALRTVSGAMKELVGEARWWQAVRTGPPNREIGVAILPRARVRNGFREIDVREKCDLRNAFLKSRRRSGDALRVRRGSGSAIEEKGGWAVKRGKRLLIGDEAGNQIAGIIDCVGEAKGAPMVVIMPAWAKQKESFGGLANRILARFAGVQTSVAVLRYDGSWRPREPHGDRVGKFQGKRSREYTLSQGSNDLIAVMEFLKRDPTFETKSFVVVSVSAAAIEARHALARLPAAGLSGWISVVGAPDAQSLVRAATGGEDLIGGVEAGRKYGVLEIQGMTIDFDEAAADAIANGLAFLEDARMDMAKIRIPIVWFAGAEDGWISIERVREVLSMGAEGDRQLFIVPTGHELKSSDRASALFDLVADQAFEMATGKVRKERVVAGKASLMDSRVAAPRLTGVERKEFWRSYVLGDAKAIGMELLAHTSAYRDLMRRQMKELLAGGASRVIDLGSGLGLLRRELSEAAGVEQSALEVIELDLLWDALYRSRLAAEREGAISVRSLACDLDRNGEGICIPLRSGVADGALASLLVNYVSSPDELLLEIRRILRPSGRLVISSMREDADVSQLCVSGVAELRSGTGREALGDGEVKIDRSLRSFISRASELLTYQEEGKFKFWRRFDLVKLVEKAGFEGIRVRATFGRPPQAYLVTASAPRS